MHHAHFALNRKRQIGLEFRKQTTTATTTTGQSESATQALKHNLVCQETNDKLKNHLVPNNSFKKMCFTQKG